MDILNEASGIILLILGAVFALLQWQKMTKEEQRTYIEDLVRSVQQQMTDADGPAKMAFVLAEVQRRFPRFPADVARTIAEAAVNRMKHEEAKVIGEKWTAGHEAPVELYKR